MSNHILIVQLDVPEEHLAEFNKLYDGEHVPALLGVSGVISGQRYEIDRDAEDQLRYLAIYEIENPDIPAGDEWQKAANTPGWSEVRKHVTARRRGVFRKM